MLIFEGHFYNLPTVKRINKLTTIGNFLIQIMKFQTFTLLLMTLICIQVSQLKINLTSNKFIYLYLHRTIKRSSMQSQYKMNRT